jgi:hypothetical protein
MYEPVLKKMSRVLPLDHPQTLSVMVGVADTLAHLNRNVEALKMYEDVVPRLERVAGEDHNEMLAAMSSMAFVQLDLHRFDVAKQTATRGLLLARRVGNDKRAANFFELLSELEKREENLVFAATASDEQWELRKKIELRRQAKEKAAEDEAALQATRAKATTEDDLDALMAEFGFEEGDDCSGDRLRRRRVEEARRRRRRRRRGSKNVK